jgi:hypothetical protein
MGRELLVAIVLLDRYVVFMVFVAWVVSEKSSLFLGWRVAFAVTINVKIGGTAGRPQHKKRATNG